MANWRSLAKKLALSRGGVIDSKRAQILRESLLADGKIDRGEFAFLVALRREAQAVDGEFDRLIFRTIQPLLLKDGGVSLEATKWLKNLFLLDGKIDEREQRFLHDLRAAGTSHCQDFVEWCDSLEPARPRREDLRDGKLLEALQQLAGSKVDSERRWLRLLLAGTTGLLLLLIVAVGGLFYYVNAYQGSRPPSARRESIPPEHTIVKALFNDKELAQQGKRDIDLTHVRRRKVYAFQGGPWPVVLRPGVVNAAGFEEKNVFTERSRPVKMWVTLEKTAPEQAPLPPTDVKAYVNGELVELHATRPSDDDFETGEYFVRLKAGENKIRLELKHDGKDAVPARLYLSWKDDLSKVNLFVLGVGVSRYAKHPPARSLDLKYAAADARALVQVLSDQGQGLFSKNVEHKTIVDAGANKQAILGELQEIHNKAREHDLVVLVFAGHGLVHPVGEEFFFLPHDFDPQVEAVEQTALSWHDIERYLGNLPCRVVVVMDACHSGAIKLKDGRRGDQVSSEETEKAIQRFLNTRNKHGIVVIAACAKNETAQEDVKYEGGHGALTATMLRCLTTEGKGIVTLDHLLNYVKEKMPELVGRNQTVTVEHTEGLNFLTIPVTKVGPGG